MSRPWNPARHHPLVEVTPGLWHVDAELDLLPIGRRMVIARMGDGTLAVHSAVACDDATMAAIDALGPVRWIVVPSGFHRMDAPTFKVRYPDARVVCSEAAAGRVAKVVAVDGTLGHLPAGSLTCEPLDGVPHEAVYRHVADDGRVRLIFNDAFMNLPNSLPGWRGTMVKLMGSTGGPKVTRTARWGIVKDGRAYAAHLRRLAELPGLTAILPGHGAIVTTDAAAALRQAADGLHRG